MEIEIDSKVNNTLLDRTEVYFTIRHKAEGTPNREIIRSELAEKLNVKKENVIVNIIKSSFGHNVISGYAKIYNSVEKSKEIEPDYILMRNKIIDKVKKSEKKEGTSTSTKKEKTAPEKPSVEKTVEKKPEAPVETKDESKEKKQQSEKKVSDKPDGATKGETPTKELKPSHKMKDVPKKEG
jgi:small subunit ribosomal protein S24e